MSGRLLALLYVGWPGFHRGPLWLFLGDLLWSRIPAEGLGDVRGPGRAHALVHTDEANVFIMHSRGPHPCWGLALP